MQEGLLAGAITGVPTYVAGHRNDASITDRVQDGISWQPHKAARLLRMRRSRAFTLLRTS